MDTSAVNENANVQKKEKVKKRFSFRAFSFGKKDKQKPDKTKHNEKVDEVRMNLSNVN